jgi:transporter family protein
VTRWLPFAVAGALANAVAGTLVKAGLEKVRPLVATAIVTLIVTIITGSVAIARGGLADVAALDRRTFLWLAAAGVVTSASYAFYFSALSTGQSARVQPLDRLSLVFAVILAALFLHEKVSAVLVVGAVLMAAGAVTVAMAP